MMKLAASALSGALTVGAAGYSYVNRVQTESAEVKSENVTLKQDNAQKAAKITGMDLAIDEAIRKLQSVKVNSGA